LFGSTVDGAKSSGHIDIFEFNKSIIGILDPDLVVIKMNSSKSLVTGVGQNNPNVKGVVIGNSWNIIIEVFISRSNQSHFFQPSIVNSFSEIGSLINLLSANKVIGSVHNQWVFIGQNRTGIKFLHFLGLSQFLNGLSHGSIFQSRKFFGLLHDEDFSHAGFGILTSGGKSQNIEFKVLNISIIISECGVSVLDFEGSLDGFRFQEGFSEFQPEDASFPISIGHIRFQFAISSFDLNGFVYRSSSNNEFSVSGVFLAGGSTELFFGDFSEFQLDFHAQFMDFFHELSGFSNCSILFGGTNPNFVS